MPSSTGFPSKRCAGIGFFSRVDSEIGVFRHVAPPTRLRLELPHETGLILRCARKASLSITNSRSLPKPMSIVSVMPSNHFILCHPLLLLPQSFPASGSFQMSQPLSFTVSWSLLTFMSIELVMLSNHLIICHPLPLFFQSFPASGSFPMS